VDSITVLMVFGVRANERSNNNETGVVKSPKVKAHNYGCIANLSALTPSGVSLRLAGCPNTQTNNIIEGTDTIRFNPLSFLK